MERQAKFKEIALSIEDRIKKGIYVPSQMLPSEYDLAREYEVSRLTVRKAIEDLISQQIVVKKKNKGTYVIPQEKVKSGQKGLQSFSEVAKNLGKTSKTKVLSYKKMATISDEISEALQLKEDKGQEIFELVRLRLLDKEKMTLEKIYIDEKFLKESSKKELEQSLFTIIEKKMDIAYSNQEIEATLVTKDISEWMDIPVGQPLLEVHSTTYSLDGKPIFYDISYYRADKYSFKNTLIRQTN